MKPFDHYNAQSLKGAASVLAEYNGKAKINAGGTDLLGAMKDKCLAEYPEALINIKTVKDLDYIRENDKGLVIGALAKLADIADSAEVRKTWGVLGEAACSVASPQIRNVATIGGNLAQEVRCWYYRYPAHVGGPITCLRKGGKTCNALAGDSRYHSIFGAAPMKEYPCSGHCPAHTDIPVYLERVRNNDLETAGNLLLECNPIPAITGRVCPIFCEPNCNRDAFDEPVAIKCIERYVGDHILENGANFYRAPKTDSGKKVAVIGSGPSGLAAAYYLRRSGHAVVVFDKFPQAGGMLQHAIPAYRLPKGVVKKQVQCLEGMGIRFELGVDIGKDVTIDTLTAGYDAVFLAAGAWKERSLGINGEELTLSGLEFLKQVNAGEKNIPGKRVAVIGGGNVAMDVARTLIRLGAEPVVIYRRTANEMPALEEETKKAIEEGIAFEFLTLPIAAMKSDGMVKLTCQRMELGEPDASGRPQPVPVSGSDFTISVDAVVKAIGEDSDESIVPSDAKRNLTKTTTTAHLGGKLFAGGDFVSGASTVIQAVESGKEAATLIEDLLGVSRRSIRTKKNFIASSFLEIPRVHAGELPMSGRLQNMETEDVSGVNKEEATKEAQRCFNCGCLAVGPSDLAVALVALDATIVTTKRTIAARDFFSSHASASTVIGMDEVIKEVRVPRPPAGSRQHYEKFSLRKPIDFAIVSVALVITMDKNTCKDVRIVLGAVAPEPLRVHEAEKYLKSRVIDEQTAAKAGELALEDAQPFDSNKYKVQIAKTLVKRTILNLTVP